MKKIEAQTLQEAYIQAAKELNCSVTQLDTQVIQYPKNGFFGLFKKSAIIVAICKTNNGSLKDTSNIEPKQQESNHNKTQKCDIKQKNTDSEQKHIDLDQKMSGAVKTEVGDESRSFENSDFAKLFENNPSSNLKEPFITDMDNEKACAEIEHKLNYLFKQTCYKIEPIKVSMYDERTVRIFINGEDAALLIGKDGYRYKALSYILFNWINPAYGYLLRLEIAEFLQNQEEMIARYLEPVIEQIEATGRGQTRTLDGVLVQIALKELRTKFPGKYVAIKTTSDGKGKYVVVNDFLRKNDHNA